MGRAVSCHSYILPWLPCRLGLLAWGPVTPITEPGGSEAGISARTGASTIW